MKAWIVVDLGFGDAGKGTTTDFLVRDRGAGLVVRFNGGAQAGHNVVTPDGRHHTFAQFGAGTFVPGTGTHLTDAFLLHPGGLQVEAQALARAGVTDAFDRLTVDRRARVITPFQQAAVQVRELLRGSHAHGTTGIGVGECVADALAGHDDGVTAAELGDPVGLGRKLRAQQERKRHELAAGRTLDPYRVLDDADVIPRIVDLWTGLARQIRVLDEDGCRSRIAAVPEVVFEGAQGVLLDETWGFHPHTTWSDCTFGGAEPWVADRDVTRLGVIRSYSTRHGPGPFPTERSGWREALVEPHNPEIGWQGAFRVGPLDGVLLRYAADVAGPLDGLVVTWADRVPSEVCTAYDLDGSTVARLEPGAASDLEHRASLGRRLRRARPRDLAIDDPGGLLTFAEGCAGAPVRLVSSGPTANAKRWMQ